MINIVSSSLFSILGIPVYQSGYSQPGIFKSLVFLFKNKKSYENLKIVLEKLQLVNIDLEDKINGKPTRFENLALRHLDIIECKKIINLESIKYSWRLNIIVEILTLLKEKWEKRINGQQVDSEELKIMVSEVEKCRNIIGREMYTMYPFPIGIS
jgi:hypothetical protein